MSGRVGHTILTRCNVSAEILKKRERVAADVTGLLRLGIVLSTLYLFSFCVLAAVVLIFPPFTIALSLSFPIFLLGSSSFFFFFLSLTTDNALQFYFSTEGEVLFLFLVLTSKE